MTSTGDEFGIQDWGRRGVPDVPPGWVDVRYREYDKRHTLPGFWALCQRCEQLYRASDDDELVEIMKSAPGWLWDSPTDIDECLRKPLAVFRLADEGARPLARDSER